MSLINDALKRAKQSQSQKPPERPLGPALEPISTGGLRGIPVWLIPVGIVLSLIAASGLLYYGWRVSNRTQQASAPASSVTTPPSTSVPAPAQPTATAPPLVASKSSAPTASSISSAAPTASTKQPTTPRRVSVETNLVTRTTLVANVQAPIEPSTVSLPTKSPEIPSSESSTSPQTPPPISKPISPQSTPVKPEVVAAVPPTSETAPLNSPTASPAVANAASGKPASDPLPAVTEPVEWPALKLQGIFYRLSRPSASINGKTVFIGDSVGGAKVVRIERQAVYLEMRGQHKTLFLP